jgi:hypothetical protein
MASLQTGYIYIDLFLTNLSLILIYFVGDPLSMTVAREPDYAFTCAIWLLLWNAIFMLGMAAIKHFAYIHISNGLEHLEHL